MTDATDDRPTVLVIEDEALVALLVTDTLADAGYRPVWAPDGRAARPRHEGGTAALAAVVDLRLADGLDGRDVLRRLRAQDPDMPVVVVTGFHPEAPQADLRGLGGPTVRLCKPFDCDDLLERLAGVLGGSTVPGAPRPGAPRPGAPRPGAPRRRASDVAAMAAG